MDNLNEDYIIETNRNMKKDLITMDKTEVAIKYGEFEEKYPKIFLSILDEIFDEEKFKTMINIRKKSFDKHSQKNYEQKRLKSDIDVGEYLAKSFLYPVIGEPSDNDKQKAYRKLLAKANIGKKR